MTLVVGSFGALAGTGQPAPLRATDLPAAYRLGDRVLVSGKVLRRPDIAGLYAFGHERTKLKLFIRDADGTLASESSIIRNTLSEKQHCKWIENTTRNNLDAPGITNEAPPVSSHCTPVEVAGDKVAFSPPGEPVVTTYDRCGFTAVIKGQSTDHWRKIG